MKQLMAIPAALRRAFWVILLVTGITGPAFAQDSIQPAELPPASYAGKQYVDSQGCVFLRAGTEAGTVWVPRVTAGGKQLCGYPPSGNRVPIAGETGAETASPVEEAEPATVVTAPEPEPVQEETGSYLVALGSFGFQSNVDKAVSGAETLGYPVTTGKMKGGEQGLVTVFAGPFASRSSADAARDKLRKAGFPDAVVLKN